MKRIYLFIIALVLNAINLLAQMSIEEIDYQLETRPYFELEFDYNVNFTLPDKIQEKFSKALNREIPERVLDSILAFSSQQKERILQTFIKKCEEDSTCIQEQYQEYVKEYRDRHTKMFAMDIMPTKIILASGNWQVKKAIPILKKAIGNDKYDQTSVLMALAKLGDDSINQMLFEKYTLRQIIQTTELDTINDNYFYGSGSLATNLFSEGINVAMYLENKDMILNLLDLIYIKGRNDMNIGISYTVAWFINHLSIFHFQNYPNVEVLNTICDEYLYAIWDLEKRKRTQKEQNELDNLLSKKYRTKIKEQLQKWVTENVNFN